MTTEWQWTQYLIAFAVCLQSIEFLLVKSDITGQGVWSWSILREDYSHWPKFLRRGLDLWFADRSLILWLWLRLFAALLLFVYSHVFVIAVLWLTTYMIAVRWRGTFNGGSDSMTLVVLTALLVISAFGNSPHHQALGMWYIALHSCWSYVAAGVVKLQARSWLSGRELQNFLEHSPAVYPSALTAWLKTSPRAARWSSWSVIGFECLFPVVIFSTWFISIEFTVAVLVLGMSFHFANTYMFGLNRFFWAWLATYPAIYFCSQQLSH